MARLADGKLVGSNIRVIGKARNAFIILVLQFFTKAVKVTLVARDECWSLTSL